MVEPTLQDRRSKLAATIRELAARQDKWSAEDAENWDKVNADYDGVLAEMEKQNAADAKAKGIANRVSAVEALESKSTNTDAIGLPDAKGNTLADPIISITDETRALALQAWMRSGPGNDPNRVGPVTDKHREAAKACKINIATNELRVPLCSRYAAAKVAFRAASRNFHPLNTLTTHTGSSGGFTFGDSFVTALEVNMLAYGGMLQVAEVIRTGTAEPMRWPTGDDTSNTGVQIGESTAVATADPTFAQVVWNAYKFSSKEILVPYELLRDSAFDLASILAGMLGERLGRIQNTKYTTGDGAATPKGIITAASAGVTAASATAITMDEIIDLEHSINPAYRNGGGYMMHDGVLQYVRKLKDGESRYLWQAGANTGAPDSLNGYPYTINQDMASTVATGNKTILFGQLSKYKIRQVGALRLYRLTERHRESDQDAFLAFIEGDGNLLDAGTDPVKFLQQA